MRGKADMKTAGIICRFCNIGEDTILADCCTKTDPWKTEVIGSPDILVEEHLSSWSSEELICISEENISGTYNKVYRDSQNNLYFVLEHPENRILICWKVEPKSGHITLVIDNTHTSGFFAFEHIGTVLPFLFLKYNVFTMHGVLMEYKDQGIILTADSGVGKTTHARLWRDYKRAFIINGDRILVKEEDTIWTGYGQPWSGSSGEQMNRSVPIHAVVQIVRGKENHVEKLDGMEAFSVVLGQLLTPAWDKELAEKAVDMAMQMLEKVPVYRLYCTPDKEAVDVLEAALFG